MWNPLSWVMEMAAIMAIALANGSGKPPDWQDFVGIVVLFVINSTISFIEETNAGIAAAALMAGLAPKMKVSAVASQLEADAWISGSICNSKGRFGFDGFDYANEIHADKDLRAYDNPKKYIWESISPRRAKEVKIESSIMSALNADEKSAYEKWERSNRLSLMIMKGCISSDRGVPNSENAKDFLDSVEEQFQSSSKALATTLIIKMDKRLVKKNNDGNKAKTSGSKTRKCNFCRKPTHFQKDCPKFKEWLTKKGKMSSYVCYESFLANVPIDTWWIDSGASVHITSSSQGFRFTRKLNKGEHSVLVGNGNKVPVEVVGTLPLVLESGFKLDLFDTVYVLSITRNLISVSRLVAHDYSVLLENKDLCCQREESPDSLFDYGAQRTGLFGVMPSRVLWSIGARLVTAW
ncbi:hypothetical protein ZIOFF_066254 [Zingiber officinale]|uniref:Retrovirus-related Pol polyprotein from transposon TNT 1-94-like beta-barrel domain-containing protein n=1 Tax=Zingiber officinale TaxID=94328 RepID=A0A8J5EYF5_ZINOF|nr:hypothetical protein ZIOFF_066254 [Zingiber officinale]